MEDVGFKWRLENLSHGDGDGDGSGHGSGYGYGYGYGYGSGHGSGDGDGYGDGDGSGDGSGDGDGSGYGSGDGYGDGSGDGYGSDDGDGYGDGYGDGIKTVNGRTVYHIDGMPTIIDRTKGDVAHGYILQGDLTLKECYIAKGEGLFAHGDTIREAVSALQDKLAQKLPPVERVKMFIAEHNTTDKYPARDLFVWHHRLTGSCKAGRESFCRARSIDVESASFTVAEFVNITKNAYGCEVIHLLGREIGMEV